ncbi:MAG: DUF29 domain-containing protein [Candidatus Competibacteraceae bacterium]|jgi:hypothetical protein|nr:DUF29 domain-containing protein [Candidatus Competibacteraceae bacterium]
MNDYETDFYAWAMANASALRLGHLNQIDAEHIAEELETLGKAEKRELSNRLAVLLTHLLKWAYQPERQGNSWRYTIQEQRVRVRDVIQDNPSLKATQDEALEHAYRLARLRAARQTGKDLADFPAVCPWMLEQALDEGFWPGRS